MTMRIYRYNSKYSEKTSWLEIILNIVDIILYVGTLPFTQLFGLCASCYLSISKIKKQTYLKWIDTLELNSINEHFIKGPILALLTLSFLPVGAASFIVWSILSKCFKKNNAAYLVFSDESKKENTRDTFRFVSGNLLLGPEFLGKMQNLPDAHKRMLGTAQSLSMCHFIPYSPNCTILEDNQITTKGKRDSAVIEKWPEGVDFVCLQEVWDRLSAISLIFKMRNKFKHFLTDICQDPGNSNYYFRSSGLFVASKYPIMETTTEFFDPIAFYQNVFTHAYVFLKVDLSSVDPGNAKLVGYIANTHLPSYESENSRNISPLSKLHDEYNKFQKRTKMKDEVVAFAIIAGDFNLCNISKCDRREQNNRIYEEYRDYCSIKAGVDHEWTVGTEVRQLSLPDPGFRSAEALNKVLKDDVKRRYYILDADLEEITPLTPFLLPKQDEDGKVKPLPASGGKRRVDKILYNPDCLFGTPSSFHFVTALAPFTDHIPVSLELKRNTWSSYIS